MGGEIAQEGRGIYVFEGGEDYGGNLVRVDNGVFEVEELGFDRVGDRVDGGGGNFGGFKGRSNSGV